MARKYTSGVTSDGSAVFIPLPAQGKISTVSTYFAPSAIGPYSQAIVLDNMVFTSGQIAIDPDKNKIVAADIEGQAEQVMKNIAAILDMAGSSMEKVVKTTCFLADINDFEKFNEVYAKHFTTKPARSCVEVSALPKGALCEVEVIAAK